MVSGRRASVAVRASPFWWRRSKSAGQIRVMANDEAKAARERAKAIAEQRRAERKNRKRKCVLCGVEESDKTPLGPHPDGIGPSCKDEMGCQTRRAQAR